MKYKVSSFMYNFFNIWSAKLGSGSSVPLFLASNDLCDPTKARIDYLCMERLKLFYFHKIK